MGIKGIIPQSIKNSYHYIQALLAHTAYGFPAEMIKAIGITGTDGKTTTSYMIYSILKEAGYKVGLLTTVSAKIGTKTFPTGLHITTPDPWIVPKLLSDMVKEHLKWVVFEVTSHGLDQNRLALVTFDKAVFTNITHEHLDYHKTYTSYAHAKAKLLDHLKEGSEVVLNRDEKGSIFIEKMIKINKKVLIPIVVSNDFVKNAQMNREGIRFDYKIKGKVVQVSIPILGKYNIKNAQYAIHICENMVENRDMILRALRHFKGIRGRMQIVRRKKPCLVIVDFAHTPNALLNALQTVNEIREKGKIIVVFGCAGERDIQKRSKMGRIAAKHADVVILTAEDPRSLALADINDQIYKGMKKTRGKLVRQFKNRDEYHLQKLSNLKAQIEENSLKKIVSVFRFDEDLPKSREDAIEFAIRSANPEDIVLITGKGHEQSLCFGKEEFQWSDVKAVKRAVEKRYKEKKDKN